MVLSVQFTTEATLGHLKIVIIAKKEETMAGQVKGKIMLELFFDSSGINCSHGIHPRGSDCKQAPLQGDPSPSTQFMSL
jgi:hypothetical protein